MHEWRHHGFDRMTKFLLMHARGAGMSKLRHHSARVPTVADVSSLNRAHPLATDLECRVKVRAGDSLWGIAFNRMWTRNSPPRAGRKPWQMEMQASPHSSPHTTR